jgi:hypothetical protein
MRRTIYSVKAESMRPSSIYRTTLEEEQRETEIERERER